MNIPLILYYGIGILATLATAGVGFLAMLRYGKSMPRWLLVVILLVPAYIFIAQYLKFQSMHMYADLSHWLQIVHSIATTGLPGALNVEFLIPGSRNYFSVHFVPLIYIFGLLYKAMTVPEILLVLNGVFMFSSVIPLYFLAKRFMSHRLSMIVTALFLWYPTFQYITLYEFEMLRFSIPIIFWMLYFYETKKTFPFFVFVGLALLVREEVSLVIAFFGLYLFLVRKERLKGLFVTGVSLTFFFTVTSVIMGAFSSMEGYRYLAIGAFREFGASPFEVVRNILSNPMPAIVYVLDSVRIGNLIMYFVPLLFIPLLAPAALIGALPNIGVGLLSEAITNSSFMLYYLAPSIPFIFYAFLKAWPRLTSWLQRILADVPETVLHGAMASAMLAGVLVVNVFFGPSPLSLQFWIKDIRPAPFRTQDFYWSTYRVTDHHRAVDAFVAMIPADTIVSTQQFLMPRTYHKRGTMVYPEIVSQDGSHRATYVLLDTTNNGLRHESPAYISETAMNIVRTDSARWEVLAQHDGYELYRLR